MTTKKEEDALRNVVEVAIINHHIITGRASFSLMLESLSHHYRRVQAQILQDGATITPLGSKQKPRSRQISYAGWSHWLHIHQQTPREQMQLQKKMAFWRKLLGALSRFSQAQLFIVMIILIPVMRRLQIPALASTSPSRALINAQTRLIRSASPSQLRLSPSEPSSAFRTSLLPFHIRIVTTQPQPACWVCLSTGSQYDWNYPLQTWRVPMYYSIWCPRPRIMPSSNKHPTLEFGPSSYQLMIASSTSWSFTTGSQTRWKPA